MIPINLSEKSVLITGGTKGIGLASALEFGRAGARTYLTYKWGSADQSEIFSAFEKFGAPPPRILQADVSVDEDTDSILEAIGKNEERIDYFISNVGVARRTRTLREYRKRSLFKTLEYSTWPMIEYARKIHKKFGSFPRHILGISSDGPDHFYQGYDFVAASKALLEFFAKYLSIHLFEEGSRVNVIRFGPVKTESFDLIFGEDFFRYLQENKIPDDMVMSVEECGKAVLAVCSGMLDAMNGQIITVDKGMTFKDNLMMRYLAWKNRKEEVTSENKS